MNWKDNSKRLPMNPDMEYTLEEFLKKYNIKLLWSANDGCFYFKFPKNIYFCNCFIIPRISSNYVECLDISLDFSYGANDSKHKYEGTIKINEIFELYQKLKRLK